MKHSRNKCRSDDSFKIGIRQVLRLHVCCIHFGKIWHCRINISQCDYKFPKNEIHTILCVYAKIIVVYKSPFQVTKTLKINIMKHSRNKYRTDDSFKICFGQVCTIARLLYPLWKDKALQFKHNTSRL